ncbi:MAG: hypothetical protein AABY87_01750, partial [bacterium]
MKQYISLTLLSLSATMCSFLPTRLGEDPPKYNSIKPALTPGIAVSIKTRYQIFSCSRFLFFEEISFSLSFLLKVSGFFSSVILYKSFKFVEQGLGGQVLRLARLGGSGLAACMLSSGGSS